MPPPISAVSNPWFPFHQYRAFAKWMFNPRIKVGKGLEDVFSVQAFGDRLGHDVAAWWVKYLLPKNGVLLDCFAGSGTMLLAGLDFGASRVIGIDKQKKYLKIAEKRLCE